MVGLCDTVVDRNNNCKVKANCFKDKVPIRYISVVSLMFRMKKSVLQSVARPPYHVVFHEGEMRKIVQSFVT